MHSSSVEDRQRATMLDLIKSNDVWNIDTQITELRTEKTGVSGGLDGGPVDLPD